MAYRNGKRSPGAILERNGPIAKAYKRPAVKSVPSKVGSKRHASKSMLVV